VRGAATDIEKKRNEPDAFGQQADDLLGYARPQGRIDHAHDAAPTGKGHAAIPLNMPAAGNRGPGKRWIKSIRRNPFSSPLPSHIPRPHRGQVQRGRAPAARRSRHRPRSATGSARPPSARNGPMTASHTPAPRLDRSTKRPTDP